MKKTILTALLLAGFAGSAFGQAASADIILGFRDTANPGAGNLMINLGSASVLNTEAGGGTVTVTNILNSGTYGASTISGIFGAGWNTSSTLKWAAVGGVNNTDTTNPNGVKDTLFATKIANSSLLDGVAVTTGWNTGSTTTQANATALITPMYTNWGTGSFKNPAVSATGAWSKQEVPASGTTYFGYFAGGPTVLENTTNISASYVASDLWTMSPTGVGTGVATFLGTLAIFSNGDVNFTAAAAAIPEPSTYAAILGAAVLGFVMLRRRNQLALI